MFSTFKSHTVKPYTRGTSPQQISLRGPHTTHTSVWSRDSSNLVRGHARGEPGHLGGAQPPLVQLDSELFAFGTARRSEAGDGSAMSVECSRWHVDGVECEERQRSSVHVKGERAARRRRVGQARVVDAAVVEAVGVLSTRELGDAWPVGGVGASRELETLYAAYRVVRGEGRGAEVVLSAEDVRAVRKQHEREAAADARVAPR